MIRELLGLIYVFLGLLILLSLWSFDVKDPTLNQTISGDVQVSNAAGRFGAYLAGMLTGLFGFASYLWGIFFLAMGAGLVSSWFVLPWYRWIGYMLLGLCVLTASEAWTVGIRDVQGGGALGAMLYRTAHTMLSPAGSALAWFFALLIAMELSFTISWLSLAASLFLFLAGLARHVPRPALRLPHSRLSALPSGKGGYGAGTMGQGDGRMDESLSVQTAGRAAKSGPGTGSAHHARDGAGSKDGLRKASDQDRQGPILDIMIDRPASAKGAGLLRRLLSGRPAGPAAPVSGGKAGKGGKKGKGARLPLPLPDLLSLPAPARPGEDRKLDPAALEAKGAALITGLLNFGIESRLARITPGPVVTMFEVRPEPGVKVSRIASLSHDLAMSLKAVSVRIQAPIPGTDTVGVEVPNAQRLNVNFREIVETETFQNAPSLLSVALGKDIGGRPVAADLAKMPHLLVAGATGAGKSVALNAIILSLLYKARPDEVQMLLVDPKRVELAMYADLPHLIHPVVTEMDLAKAALNWALEEMERRYTLFSQTGVRNITGYNEKIAKLPDPCPEEMQGLAIMPFMVIIVDELADLMMTRGKEVENAIVRLAQLARAAGMHLIIATQRPSVDVVTGLIKANFPCRMAFQVTSSHDSRTILDSVGAEALLGKGDMLFKPSGGKLQRLHGAFVSDDDVNAVVAYWKKLSKPKYSVDFSQMLEEDRDQEGHASTGVEDDPVYAEAVAFAKSQGRISISQLQRRFRVGYNRAARYMEQMELDGVVSPGDSSKPRQVIL